MAESMVNDDKAADGVRIDIWLDVACLFRTRSEAQKACRAGKVSANGQTVKPNRQLRVGDEIEISHPLGRKQRLKVRTLADKHIAKAEARNLYEDLTPPLTQEEIEARKIDRMYRAARPLKAPDKRQRRALRKMAGKE
jgi:ribosome-associated heat shock protein Hsp15